MNPTDQDVQAAYMAWMRFEMDDTIGHSAGSPFFTDKKAAYENYVNLKRAWEKANGEWNPQHHG